MLAYIIAAEQAENVIIFLITSRSSLILTDKFRKFLLMSNVFEHWELIRLRVTIYR